MQGGVARAGAWYLAPTLQRERRASYYYYYY